MNKILKTITNVMLIIIIVLLSLYTVLKVTNKVEIYNVETGSMEDEIYVGDYILILKNTDYKVGDVVTFKKDGYHITHRIIREEGDKIITKGDANNVEDDGISKDDIIGKVILKGGLLNFIINYKFVLIFFFLSIYMLSYYFDSMKKEQIKETIEVSDKKEEKGKKKEKGKTKEKK